MLALLQLGWPPPLAESAAAANGQQPKAAGRGPFVDAPDAALAEVQRLLLAMVTLQHSADAESFAAVRAQIVLVACRHTPDLHRAHVWLDICRMAQTAAFAA